MMEVYHTSDVVVEQPDTYYSSVTSQLIEEGVADLHCRSDLYLAEEVWWETVD